MESEGKMNIEKAIFFLKDCQQTHREWAEYFEKNPEEEHQMVGTGEWDDALTHRKIISKYDDVIYLLRQIDGKE